MTITVFNSGSHYWLFSRAYATFMQLSEFEYPDFHIENAVQLSAVLGRQMRRILLGFLKNSFCFNMRTCRVTWNVIDSHTQHCTFGMNI